MMVLERRAGDIVPKGVPEPEPVSVLPERVMLWVCAFSVAVVPVKVPLARTGRSKLDPAETVLTYGLLPPRAEPTRSPEVELMPVMKYVSWSIICATNRSTNQEGASSVAMGCPGS